MTTHARKSNLLSLLVVLLMSGLAAQAHLAAAKRPQRGYNVLPGL
jgi:hypothetical protein